MNQKKTKPLVLFKNETGNDCPTIDQFNNWVGIIPQYKKEFIQVSIEIVDKHSSQKLNKTYRGIDKATNVLSFPLDLPEIVEEDLIGDLAICAKVVEQEAKQQNKLLEHHWAHLTIHGVLHLLGHDHINNKDAEVMEALEVELLAKLNIKNPYTEKI